MTKTRSIALSAVLLLLLAAPASAKDAPARYKDQKLIETFRANAAAMQSGEAFSVQIGVERWTTDAERETLLTTLQEKGPEKLLQALMAIRPRAGYLRTPNSTTWNLYYARNNPLPDGGRQVVLASNRRIAFGEAVNATRSSQYTFTLIELRFDAKGKGEGKFAPAAKIGWDRNKRTLEIENYSSQPIALIDVTAKTP